MLALLIWLLFFALVLVVIVYVLDLIPLPDKVKLIAKIIIGLIFLLYLLQALFGPDLLPMLPRVH